MEMDNEEISALEMQLDFFEFEQDPYSQEYNNPSPEKKEKFLKLLKRFVDASNQLDYYWQHCSFKTYKFTFENRVKEYENKFIDAEPIDFYKKELSSVKYSVDIQSDTYFELAPERPMFKLFNAYIDIDFIDDETQRNFELAYQKKIDFLKSKIDSIENHQTDKTEPQKLITQQKDIDIDLSDMSGAETIILLNELGVIDFLRNKHTLISNNKLASIISGITGIDSRTVQSYINPIINTACEQNKSPYNSTSTVEKVKKKIEKLDL